MMNMNPFMKQLIAAKPALPQGPNPTPAAPGFFLPQQGMNLRPPMDFGAAQQPQIPLRPPQPGASMVDQLRQMDPRRMGNWTIDPTNPEQLLQYSGKF